MEKWNISLQEHFSIVAVDDDVIVAFGDIDKTGCLDRLYVHSDYQGKGIATAICDQLEAAVQGSIVTHASIINSFLESYDFPVKQSFPLQLLAAAAWERSTRDWKRSALVQS